MKKYYTHIEKRHKQKKKNNLKNRENWFSDFVAVHVQLC